MPSKNNWVTLSAAQEQERMIPESQAASINNISLDTWKRRYRHLTEQISPRRNGVRMKNALNPTPPKAA